MWRLSAMERDGHYWKTREGNRSPTGNTLKARSRNHSVVTRYLRAAAWPLPLFAWKDCIMKLCTQQPWQAWAHQLRWPFVSGSSDMPENCLQSGSLTGWELQNGRHHPRPTAWSLKCLGVLLTVYLASVLNKFIFFLLFVLRREFFGLPAPFSPVWQIQEGNVSVFQRV